jgi:hypothetical protein
MQTKVSTSFEDNHMRLHMLVAAAVLAASAPSVARAQEKAVQRWPSREASPSPASGSAGDAGGRTAVPRGGAPERRAPERAQPERAAEPRRPASPAAGTRDRDSTREREARRRWPSGDEATTAANRPGRAAVPRPDATAGEVSTNGPVWNVRHAPHRHTYGYDPLYLYPYGYGAFGPGYFYYSPYAWAGPLYAYGPGFYGHAQDEVSNFGRLQIKVAQREAQVYVDGYFAGTVNDYDGVFQSLKLEAGTYHIQLVQPGFQTLEFDVRITPGQKITYSGALQPGS